MTQNEIEEQDKQIEIAALIKLGFRDCSYPKLESQKLMLQFIDESTNLIVNLSEDEWEISDGRATVQKVYWKGNPKLFSATLAKVYFGNLKVKELDFPFEINTENN